MKKYDQRLYHILWYSPGTLVPSEDDGGGIAVGAWERVSINLPILCKNHLNNYKIFHKMFIFAY